MFNINHKRAVPDRIAPYVMLKHVNAKCKFFCQSNVSYYLEVTKKIPERSSYVYMVLKRVA